MKQYKFSSWLNVVFFIFLLIFTFTTTYLYFDLVGRINYITEHNNIELLKHTNNTFNSCFEHEKTYFDTFVEHSPIHTCLDLDIDSQLNSIISKSVFNIIIKKRTGEIFHNTNLNIDFIDYIINIKKKETFYLLNSNNLFYIYQQDIVDKYNTNHQINPHVIYYIKNMKDICNINEYFDLNNINLLYKHNKKLINILNDNIITDTYIKLNEHFYVQFKNDFINIIITRFKYYYYGYMIFIIIICSFFSKYIYIKICKPIKGLEQYCKQKTNIDFLNNFNQTNLIEINNLAYSFREIIKYVYEKEEQYRLIVNSIHDVVWLSDMDLNFKYVTPSSIKLFNLTPKQVLEILNDRITFSQLYKNKDFEILLQLHADICNNNIDLPVILKLKQFVHNLKTWIWVSLTINEVKKDNERIGLIGIIQDIDNEENAIIALRKNEQRYRLFVENFQGIVFQSIINKSFVFLHGTVEKITGYNENDFINQKITWRKITHEDDLEKILIRTKKLKESPDKTSDERKYRIIKKDGTVKWIREFIYKVTVDNEDLFQGIVVDITNQKSMEDLIEQTKRMSYLGTMAAGIAHEINNPLTAILQYSELLLDDFKEGSENFEILNDMIYSSERIAKIVRTLLTYSRTGSDLIINNINNIINNAISFSKDRLQRFKIEISFESDKQYVILCNKNLIEQIFINLINNAIDAINEKQDNTERIIQIKLNQIDKNVRIYFKDLGIGMDKKTKENIFIPFYTTKDPDKGTGLGMSLTQTFIFDNNGTIEVESVQGKYTLFNISFPIYEDK